MGKSNKFYKNNPNDKIWWVDTFDKDGVFEFSFDKKTVFNLFSDYPHKLTKEQANIEAKKIYDEWSKEIDEIKKKAKEKGDWLNLGLDTNGHLFKKANERAKKKLADLKSRTKG